MRGEKDEIEELGHTAHSALKIEKTDECNSRARKMCQT